LVGWFVGWLAAWLVSCLVGWLLGWFFTYKIINYHDHILNECFNYVQGNGLAVL